MMAKSAKPQLAISHPISALLQEIGNAERWPPKIFPSGNLRRFNLFDARGGTGYAGRVGW
jgi:hypothetical protein